MWRHHEQVLHNCGKCTQRDKGYDERRRDRHCHDQPESHSGRRGCLNQEGRGQYLSEMRPRTLHLQHCFRTDLALPWMEPRRAIVYLDQSVPRQSRRSWNVEEYQPSQRWRFNVWSGGPGTISGQGGGAQDPPPIHDWTAQMQALAANPAWAQEQFAQWQLPHQQFQHL